MRTILMLFIAILLTGCTFFQKIAGKKTVETAETEIPTNLPAPAYDPATSPRVMTSATPLPVPAGTAPAPGTEQPAAYGQAAIPSLESAAGDPTTEVTQAAPAGQGAAPTYPAPASAPPTTYASKGVAAPSPYANASPMAPPTAESAALAATLNGLWVNTADPDEVVEFTMDHYTTFYKGEKLLEEPMTYHANCPGDCNGGQVMEIACFTVSGPAGTDCYGIVRMTPEVLELSMLGVSTQTVVYRKR